MMIMKISDLTHDNDAVPMVIPMEILMQIQVSVVIVENTRLEKLNQQMMMVD